MLRVADSFSGSDTGRQRRHNEDSLYARAPLFVVADGMGGAQAGEVASRIAVDAFAQGLADADGNPEQRLADRVRDANLRIHELSQSNAEQAGMGTTLTALYVAPDEVVIAHVGDSRAYCLRDGELLRLTDDHSLVDELLRQGRLTPEEAEDHPQRSIITRALGPEPEVEVDTRTQRARAGDLYLLCSDGLTSMISEADVAEILRTHTSLREAGEALLAAANDAGGRDNITVVLVRLEDVGDLAPEDDQPTIAATVIAPVAAAAQQPTRQGTVPKPQSDPGSASAPASAFAGSPSPSRSASVAVAEPPTAPVERRLPRRPSARRPAGAARPRRRRRRWLGPLAFVVSIVAILLVALYLATTAVYFVGTDNRGFVTVYSGLPYVLPFGLRLYDTYYVSGVPASTIPPARRKTLLDHSLRSVNDASTLVQQLELGQIAGAS